MPHCCVVNCSRNAKKRRRDGGGRMGHDPNSTQMDDSLACDCNIEQFESRLAAVELGWKTSQEATKEWSARIEQTEVDLVNLHQQMYTVLSKVEFVAPDSEVFVRNAGDSTPKDFFEPSLYKVPEIVLETKADWDQGDFARHQRTEDWSSAMEKELTERIRELSNSGTTSQITNRPFVISPVPTDVGRIKEAIIKKKEELKEKTKDIVKAMEEAVQNSVNRKNKLGVHSHFVAPYKRIQHADCDDSNFTAAKVK